MQIDEVTTLQYIFEKRLLLMVLKKVDTSFIDNETFKPIYNETYKTIIPSPKIEHPCGLQ